jgi:hypothetical protein
MSIRRIIGKITSPFFVPLRKLVVWGDKKFGTCDMKLSIEPRYHALDGFADMDSSPAPQISELMKKVSKDKVNVQGLVDEEDFRDTLSYAGASEEE